MWITQALRKSIITKNKLYKKYKENPFLNNERKYKSYRNKLHNLLRSAERNYYQNLVSMHKGNLKKSWQIIKTIIGKKKSDKVITNKFNINNKIVTDPIEIANKFNDFYINIDPNLASKIPSVEDNISPTSYIKHNYVNSIYLKDVDETEIENIIRDLKNSSPGHDGITPHILKQISGHIIKQLVHVFNLSIQTGVFPDEMKVAKVVPLFKGGDKCSISNYRPVSILSVFSKILERLMYNRIMEYVNKHEILYNYQFGFRKNYSTTMALSVLVDKIINSIEKGNYLMGLFLDFSKAFDTVNHSILLEKLDKYGLRGITHKWISNYLTNRKQFVCYNNSYSTTKDVVCGVPQGSILGPLLFLLYINDIVNVSNKLFPILFADDTNVFIEGQDLNDMTVVMNRELCKLVIWLNINKLSLNVKKTHVMIFRSKHRKCSNHNREIQINGQIISKVESTKFVGVIIDEHLSWRQHIHTAKSLKVSVSSVRLKSF